jgi:hypothetical protein
MKAPLSIFLIIASLMSCNQEDCPRYFQIPATISPAKSEYHLGDTITIVSKFHRKVLAFNSNQEELRYFDMQGILWEPVTIIQKTDTIGAVATSSIQKNFEFIYDPAYDYKYYNFSEGGDDIDGEYTYANDTFSLVVKLVAKRPGTFLLRQGSGILAGESPQDYPGSCNKYDGFDVWVQMNGGIGNNIELLNESPDTHWNTWYVQQERDNKLFSRSGGYCFKVVQ